MNIAILNWFLDDSRLIRCSRSAAARSLARRNLSLAVRRFFAVAALVWFALTSAVAGDVTSGVTFLQAPEGAKQISISLAVLENAGAGHQGYLVQRSPMPMEEVASVPASIAATYAGKEFFVYEIAALPNGIRYLAVLNDEKAIKFLNRNEPNSWYARIYRVTSESGAQPELLREGLQSNGMDVTVPVELTLPGIGSTKLTAFRTEIGYSISGGFQNGRLQVYSGRGSTLQLTGSQVNPEGKLTLTVTIPDALTVTPETQVSLQFEPLRPGLPERTAAGKITDILTLGAARFIVTAITPDLSAATLAIVAGSLEQTLKQQLEVGARMPPFAQVDLITRKTVTREDVLAKARATAGVVFVFGDLAAPGGRYGGHMGPPYGRGDSTVLPLPSADLVEQLGVEMAPKPVVVLVTRQIGIEFLYGDLRNKTPEYLILTDFADPLRTTFRMPQNPPGGWYGPSFPVRDEPTLRQSFNLPANALAVVAFDPQGKVVYVKADSGSEFLSTLADARTALALGKAP